MSFPKPPFDLAPGSADKVLTEYLANQSAFCYLRQPTWKAIRDLNDPNKEKSLFEQSRALLDLWPKVLTDALLHLKKHDDREWPGDEKGPHFFHQGSLGVDELQRVLKTFAESESMLYGASPDRYRDHLGHVLRVWLLGHALLTEQLDSKLFAPPEKVELPIGEEEWAAMWAVVALCHDLGYPLQQMDQINEQARSTLRGLGLAPAGDIGFAFSQQLLPFHDTVTRLMASTPCRVSPDGHAGQDTPEYVTHLQNKYYLKLLKSFDRLDHGVVSAMLVSKASVYFLESDLSHDPYSPMSEIDARQFLIRREILRAIASHTCADIYHLRLDTLGFFLYIVDELQFWSRPTFHEALADGARDPFQAVRVEEFSRKRISIVQQATPSWDKQDSKAFDRRINRLHRMFRLAVGTKKELKEDVYFRYAVEGLPNDRKAYLKLEKRDLELTHAVLAKRNETKTSPNRGAD